MTRINSRTKGKTAEREVIRILQPVIDEALGKDAFELERNLIQSRDGGCDITGAPLLYDILAIEVKRCENVQRGKWWSQAVAQAVNGKLPVVIYRPSRRPWRVMMEGRLLGFEDRVRVEFEIEVFAKWYGDVLRKIKEAHYDRP